MKKILNAFIYVSAVCFFAGAAIVLSSLYEAYFPEAPLSEDFIRLFFYALAFPPLLIALDFRFRTGKYLARQARRFKLLPLRLGAVALAATFIGYPLWFLIADGDRAFPFRGFAPLTRLPTTNPAGRSGLRYMEAIPASAFHRSQPYGFIKPGCAVGVSSMKHAPGVTGVVIAGENKACWYGPVLY